MPLIGLGGHVTYQVGIKKLPVRIGEKDNSRTVDLNFLVVDILMAYNVILGRPTLNTIKPVIAPYLLLMQFELDDGRIGKLLGDQRMAWKCYYVSLKSLGRRDEASPAELSRPSKLGKIGALEPVMIISALGEEHGRPHLEPAVDIIEVALNSSWPKRLLCIGNGLTPPMKDTII